MKPSKATKVLSVVLTVALIVCMTACGKAKDEEQPKKAALSMQGDVDKYVEAIDTKYAYDIAHTLSYDEKYLSNSLGFRTSGSDAEHAAADYLVSVMQDIGLSDVEKVPVTVDRWQFNDASLQLVGTDKEIMPASYAISGTDADGITAEIMDLGNGTLKDYEGKDVKGKIVLVGVDQWNEYWIDSPLKEAELQGAAAIVSYDVGGYAEAGDDAVNMQDVCTTDSIPCVSISAKDASYLKEQIGKGNNQATLVVDNIMEPGAGTSYNIVGKLPGKSSDQQMVVSAHYDIYFYGFQDDNCAIGLVLAMAKAMIDAGYEPENDILFICHGAEEWGASGSQNDWTTGAWRMINEKHPEWGQKTIAMFNFELPAFYANAKEAKVASVPEFYTLVEKFVKDGAFNVAEDSIYPKGLSAKASNVVTMEDGISYRFAGVPYFLNVLDDKDSWGNKWIRDNYHTAYDNKDTYSKEVMEFNLKLFGSLAIYVDKSPALLLDMNTTCDMLAETLDEEMAKAAGADVEAYKAALKDLKKETKALYDQAAALNEEYEKAMADGASKEDIAALREKGKELNTKELAAFKYIQDNLIGIIATSDVVIKHESPQQNIEIMDGVIAALEKGELYNDEETGALDLAYALNGGLEYTYYNHSEKVGADAEKLLFNETNPDNVFWGLNKVAPLANTRAATISLVAENDTDYADEIAIYKEAVTAQQTVLKALVDSETAAMKQLGEMIKE